MKVRITIIKSNNDEKRFWYDTPIEITIGRSQNCTCYIDDPMISRMHTVLLIDPPAIRLKDLNSTNGVMINGELYGGYGNEKLLQATQLREGDELRVGNTSIWVALVEDDDEPDAVAAPETVIKSTDEVGQATSGPVRSIAVAGLSANPIDLPENISDARSPVDLNLLAPAIPGYEISTYIGSGRTGSVYRAVNLDTGEDVAIKVMFPELSFTRKMADAFRNGIDELKRLPDTHLVRYLASGDVRVNSVYLATGFIPGQTLAARADSMPAKMFPLGDACALFSQICAGLGVAHRVGVLHLDIRPSKIIVQNDAAGMVKIADIGMASIFAEAGLSATGICTDARQNLAYYAPEQVEKLRESKATADVFGAAAVFYEMLAGVGPYNFASMDNAAEVVARGDIIPLTDRRADVPAALATLVERCLVPDPDCRFQNCLDVADALGKMRL